jgi:hypothetical protein
MGTLAETAEVAVGTRAAIVTEAGNGETGLPVFTAGPPFVAEDSPKRTTLSMPALDVGVPTPVFANVVDSAASRAGLLRPSVSGLVAVLALERSTLVAVGSL